MGGESLFPRYNESGDTKTLQRKVELMEREAQLRKQSELAQQVHGEAVMKSFLERTLSVILGWITYSMFYSVFALPMREGKTKAILKLEKSALAAFFYVLLIVIVVPLIQWKLKDEAGKTKGNTIKDDVLKLVAAAMPMILLWGFMGFAVTLLTWWEDPSAVWVDNFLVSLGAIVICTAVTFLPPYAQAQKAIREKSAGDNLLARYLTIPATFTLALAAAVFSVASWIVGCLTVDFQKDLWNNIPNTVLNYLVLLVPCLVVMIGCIVVTAVWSLKFLTYDVKDITRTDDDGNSATDKYTAFLQRSVEIELVSGEMVVSACSFIYALCFKAISTTFFYSLLFTCGGACSYRQQFLWAVIITFISVKVMMLFKPTSQPWGKALQSQQILAFSLVTGYAWLDTVTGWVVAILGSVVADKVQDVLTLIYCLAFVAFWVLFALLYTCFLSMKRQWRAQREAMARELAELPWGGSVAEDDTAAVGA